MFKGIFLSESRRLRRLNEDDKNYIESIKKLKEKCIKSNFNENMIEKIFQDVIKWKRKDIENEEINTVTDRNTTTEQNTWVTSLKGLIKLTEKEKELSPNTCITYKRPINIQGHLTNYRQTSKNQNQERNETSRCGKCSLCGGRRGFINMVLESNNTKDKYGKLIQIKRKLNCLNYGIYQAICKKCNKSYIGQTKTTFKDRWTQHRSKWNKLIKMQESELKEIDFNKDEQALFKHYLNFHKSDISNNLVLANAFNVLFLSQPNYHRLDIEESFWISKTGADINIQRTILPKVK